MNNKNIVSGFFIFFVTGIILGFVFTKYNLPDNLCIQQKDYTQMTPGQLLDYQMQLEKELIPIMNLASEVKNLKDNKTTRTGEYVNINELSKNRFIGADQ